MTTYTDYSRDRIGWFFGISGWQIGALAAGSLPVFWAVKQATWLTAVGLASAWVASAALVLVPVRGRPATGWLVAAFMHAVAALLGWNHFEARAARGRAMDADQADLPGILQGIKVHDSPLAGTSSDRIALVQDHATRMWAVTASVVHPGIGMEDNNARRRYGDGLAVLLDVASRTGVVEEIQFISRTVPEDGVERELWVNDHRRTDTPHLSHRVTADLAVGLTRGSVRSEHFITVVVPESRIGRAARECGGGLAGRSRELHLLMAEIESHLRGGMGMTSVQWLTSPELALACRSGFAPSDRLAVIEALASDSPEVKADVPWSMAGPSGADAAARHYSHDAWNSISVTLGLPPGGMVMGALAPALTPTDPDERRSLLVAYPIVAQTAAQRRSANTEWAADTGLAVRAAMGMKTRAHQRQDADRARDMDARLASGHAMVRPYAVCTVTVPKTSRVSEFGRRLEASVRRCGLAPMRLDLCQDAAFAASVIPLGTGLTHRSLR